MSSRPRSFFFTALVFTAFFASGMSSLIAEVTWNRMLIVVVGNSLAATAMIIMVFMGGLGLGSYVGGRFFGRRRPSLIPYLVLELTIGVYVLLSPTLFGGLSGVFTSLSESIDNRTGLTMVRMAVSMGALLIPAFLMGATFPALIAGATPDSPTRRSARIGYLYSINTLGAAIGCFAAGYHLLFEFGVQFTLNVAFAFYMFAALCALAANFLAVRESGAATGDSVSADPEAPAEAPAVGNAARRRFLTAATFAVGFVSLAYEVLLTRLGILYLGNSVSVFALVLTGFLLGTGISAVAGTWLYGVLRRRTGGADWLFGVLALASGVMILATPYLLLTDLVVSSDQFARFADSSPRNPLPILGMIIAPTVLIGALLPIAIRMLQRRTRGAATRGAATLYALNTAGGLIGAGVANHYLVPLFGIQGVVTGLALICTVIGFVNLLAPGRSPARWAFAGVGTALVGVALFTALPDMMHLYADRIAESTQAEKAEVRLVHEGHAATVTVIDQSDPRRGTYRDMYLNGVEEASTRYWHVQLFKLLGIFPVLLHDSDQPKDVMVIAFGAGITAGSVLASDEVAALDVVDLNPDIEGINDLFTEVNGDVFHRPRFHFHNDDGRNYLVTSNKRYDLIIGDSTHPRAYDSWILYTEEFYRSVARRLKPGGIFAQWVPVHGSMQGDLFLIHLNTFRTVFPTATMWYVYGSDQAFLMATPEPFTMDAPALQAKLDRLPPWFRAEEYQLDTVTRIGGFFWMDPAMMAKMIGDETRINRDDVHFFDKQSAVWPAAPQRRMPFFQASVAPYLTGADAGMLEALREEQAVALGVARYGFFRSLPDLYQAYCRMPGNGNARYFMAREFSEQVPPAETFCAHPSLWSHWTEVALNPENALALNALADMVREAGEPGLALPWAERAVARAPENGMILDTYGWILHELGRRREALDALKAADLHLSGHPIVLYHLGAAQLAVGERDAGRETLERALALSDNFDGASDARRLLQEVR